VWSLVAVELALHGADVDDEAWRCGRIEVNMSADAEE